MTESSFTISETAQTGKKSTKAITNINPSASPGQISALAKALNALTTNTLNTVNRIDKTEVDTGATYVDLTPNLVIGENPNSAVTVDGNTITASDANLVNTTDYASMANVTVKFSVNNTPVVPTSYTVVNNSGNSSYVSICQSAEPSTDTLEIYISKTDPDASTYRANMSITFPAGKFNPGTGTVYYNSATINVITTD